MGVHETLEATVEGMAPHLGANIHRIPQNHGGESQTASTTYLGGVYVS